ncbi:MAG: NAD-dependent epimerase/dehydratase family protein [Anaerolineae bacterium]|nr:NAD-dependent epimerase/dehydratase family protein [Anaerolineae bacterium]
MSTAFVTGATGFIGSALTRRLLNDGVKVRILCRDPHKGEALRQLGAEVISGDVQLIDSLRRGAQGCEVIYSVAAALGGTGAAQYNVSVQGTRNLAQVAHELGISRYVHVSSIAAYGSYVTGEVDESQPLKPSRHDFYEQAKALSEQALWKFAEKTALPVTVIRPGMVYGPEANFWTKTFYDVFSRIPIPLIGESKGTAHPIYIDDVVDLMVTQATHPNAVGQAFNCSADPAPTWIEFVGYYARMAGNTQTIKLPEELLITLAPIITALSGVTGEPVNVSGFLHYATHPVVFSMKRAANLLDWRPRVGLEEGMKQAERWLHSLADAATTPVLPA